MAKDIDRRMARIQKRIAVLEAKTRATYTTTRIAADSAELARAIVRDDRRGIRKNVAQMKRNIEKLGTLLK